MRSEICFLCIMFELLSLLRDRHCRRCAPLNGMEGRSARRPTNAGSWCGLQPYFSVSSFTYVRVKCVASLPSCPENHDEIAASYAAVVAKAAAARRRRRLRDRAPSFALSSASTSAYCDGDETTATAAWFFAAERIIDGPARNDKQRSTGTKSMTRACMRLPTYTWGYAMPPSYAPPMSTFSMHVSKSAPLATVASNAYRLTMTRSAPVNGDDGTVLVSSMLDYLLRPVRLRTDRADAVLYHFTLVSCITTDTKETTVDLHTQRAPSNYNVIRTDIVSVTAVVT